MEAIVPTEIGIPMLRTDMPEQSNTESVIKDLNIVDELHETAVVRITSYHNRLENLYNRHVKPQMFQPGDLVLGNFLRTNPIRQPKGSSQIGRDCIL